MSKFCKHCGSKLTGTAQYCKYCGIMQKCPEEPIAEKNEIPVLVEPSTVQQTPDITDAPKPRKRKKHAIIWISIGSTLLTLFSAFLILIAIKRTDAPFYGIDPGDSAFMVKLILGEPDRIREAETPIDPDFIYYYDTTISGIKGMLSLHIKDGKVDDLRWTPSSVPTIENFDTLVNHFTKKYGEPLGVVKYPDIGYARAGWNHDRGIEVRISWISSDDFGHLMAWKSQISED